MVEQSFGPNWGLFSFLSVCLVELNLDELRVSRGDSRKCEVATLRFWVLGFRGDWKALVQILNLERSYNDNKEGYVCDLFCFKAM